MAEYSREELLQMLGETEEPKPHTVEVRGRTITVDDARLKSWPVVVAMSKLTDQDGLHATVSLMDIVTQCTDLEQDDVLDMCGGPMADFGDVANALAEISGAILPKA